jgi:hypothetical protein
MPDEKFLRGKPLPFLKGKLIAVAPQVRFPKKI